MTPIPSVHDKGKKVTGEAHGNRNQFLALPEATLASPWICIELNLMGLGLCLK